MEYPLNINPLFPMKIKLLMQFLLVLFVFIAPWLSVMAQSTNTIEAEIAIKAARLLDVRTGKVITNPIIVVNKGKIVAVGTDVKISPQARQIQLGNVTLLPGLIDTHTHLLQNYNGQLGGDNTNMILTVTQMSTAKRALLGAAMGKQMLEVGFTSVRDLGNSGVNGDIALRDAINAGWIVGPRIHASSRALAPAGGQFGPISPETQSIIAQEYVTVSTVEEARRAVRQAIYDGATWIKVIANQGRMRLSAEELKAIVEEATRLGRPVAAHVTDDVTARLAIEVGVTSIEHGYELSDQTLQLMSQKKTFLIPTDGPLASYILSPHLSPEARKQQEENIKPFIERSRDRLRRAVKVGVLIAAGSDAYYQIPDQTRGQAAHGMFKAYAEAGMSPMQIIQSATIQAATLLGWHDRVGSVEAGKFADLIAVENDPLENIENLSKVVFVMKAGEIVKSSKAD